LRDIAENLAKFCLKMVFVFDMIDSGGNSGYDGYCGSIATGIIA